MVDRLLGGTVEVEVELRRPYETKQAEFVNSTAKRKIIRGGRRGGKTTGIAILALLAFLSGKRVLYATPTSEQIDGFWPECKRALNEVVELGVYYKNETRHLIEVPGTEQRIRAKTAWNADSLRGDYADLLILDEFQLMNEDTWNRVGAPMMLDNDGDAVFVYTPPSFHSRSMTKANDPQHAAKMFKKALADTTGRWGTFHFTSMDNPTLSREALEEISKDMSALAYRQEILAEDIDDIPGALWTRDLLDKTRETVTPTLYRIVVAVDPAASTGQTGIVVAGIADFQGIKQGYTIDDVTTEPGASPSEWATAIVAAYHKWSADVIVGEVNNGGDMIESVIRNVRGGETVNYKTVRATRGKYTRAEPISALFENGRAHMVGYYSLLEDELCSWVPGDDSPNRLDAMTWAFTELLMEEGVVGSVKYA